MTNSATQTEAVIILSMDTLTIDIAPLSMSDKSAIAYELGRSECKRIREQTFAISNERGLKQLMQLRTNEYINRCNPVLIIVLSGITHTKQINQSSDILHEITQGDSIGL